MKKRRESRDADRRDGSETDRDKVDQIAPLSQALDVTLDFLNQIFDRITPSPRPPVTDVVDLEDVVRYFIEKHPGDPKIAAGALIRVPHPKGQLLFQVFLDGDNHVCLDDMGRPYGQRVVARSLGRELRDKFSSNDLVIFR